MPIQAAVGVAVIPLLLNKEAAADRQRTIQAALSLAIADGLDISNAEEVRLVVERSKEASHD